MLLLLLRHADAGVSDLGRWPDDADRPLTDLGRETQRRVSEMLRDAGFGLDALFTSPLLRARQTAEIVADVFQLPDLPTVCDSLDGAGGLSALKDCVGERTPSETVGVVGHSVWLETFATLLLSGWPTGIHIDFPKSGAMAIRANVLVPGAGSLVAFLTPDYHPPAETQFFADG